MKQKFRMLLLMAVFTFMLSAAYGAEPKLTDEEKAEFSERIKQKIEDFQSYLSIINSKESLSSTVNAAVKNGLKLFIGSGESYYTTDAYGNRITNAPVEIQVSSKNGRIRSQSVKSYLQGIAGKLNKMYSQVKITSSEAVRVDNIHETGDGRYECVAYFFQKFEGYRDGRLVYTDVTTKKVRVYLEQIEGPVGKTWSIALGDISVVEKK